LAKAGKVFLRAPEIEEGSAPKFSQKGNGLFDVLYLSA
jgi:hypothetical protein